MKVLFTTSESVPFLKTGGLADVAGSLPIYLKKEGVDIRVVMPLYSKIEEKYRRKMDYIGYFYVDLGFRHQYAGVLSYKYKGVIYYFIDSEYYFKRDKIYGEVDDGERFIFFSKAATILPKFLDFKADIIHSNDWHTGLVPLYIEDFKKGDSFYSDIKSVHTMHNLKYQGVFPESILQEVAGLSRDYYHEDGLKYYDNINMMKAGIVYSNILTTVSKTYAQEIRYHFFGEGLEGIINKHSGKLRGIVNGIDYDEYNPKTDKKIAKNYTLKTIRNKKQNKLALQEKYGLPVDETVPIISMVTRLVAMKGLDLVRATIEELLQEDIQFVMLGTGDREYEDMFLYFQNKYPDKMAARVYFNEDEAHLIYAGSDIFLMPSMSEPCGISQLISLRYGTIPIVREVGGLKDTIEPYNLYTGKGNGFSFKNFNAHEMLFTIKNAIFIYKDKNNWNNLVQSAMNSKNDWEKSSREYIDLYENLISN
ncbi:glycogen synthase GlgA [Tissierella creatinophila]|uniref:Glycogen synthase n=1 Tax=Tissierella creatinophila DSM 6911 TaxID=1123403 RepID=A0A1U7M530_TISCR|nr:glycogen synthase GlgA [Tissierella creatinophila]OLS02298.1 glycogen synthase [Tissierella creatinophila DSM 6911]